MTFESSAEIYDRHVGRYGPGLAAQMLRIAGIRSGHRCLDVGCGPGPLTFALVERVGAKAVAAVDPSEQFVEACRARLAGVDVRLAAAEELPFRDGEFDAVLSQLVVNFMSDPEQGVREMVRVACPDGVVASCVWDYAEGMEMLRAFWDAALELDPGAPDEGHTMSFCRDGELGALLERCGLQEVETGAVTVSAKYAHFDDYWSPFPTGLAPSGAYCASLGAAERELLRQASFRRLGSPAGPFALTARAWFARGVA
jgi:SAM-dependent methyltransferase